MCPQVRHDARHIGPRSCDRVTPLGLGLCGHLSYPQLLAPKGRDHVPLMATPPAQPRAAVLHMGSRPSLGSTDTSAGPRDYTFTITLRVKA